MLRTTRVVIGSAAVSLVLSLAACSSSGGGAEKTTAAAGSSSSTSSSASDTSSATDTPSTSTDYSDLLIEAADIPVPGFTRGTPQAPPQGTGTAVAFTGEDGRTVGVTILVVDSAEQAQAAAASSVEAAQAGVTDPEVTTAPIGDGGTAIRGTAAAGEVAVLVFSDGKAVVVMEFDSAAGDPVPTDVIQQVATAQDEKIKSGLSD